MLQYCEKKILIIIMVYYGHKWQYIAVTSSSLCARSLVGDIEFYVDLEYFLLYIPFANPSLALGHLRTCMYLWLLTNAASDVYVLFTRGFYKVSAVDVGGCVVACSGISLPVAICCGCQTAVVLLTALFF